MRSLLDQEVYAVTARFPADLDRDAVAVSAMGASRVSETDLPRLAQEQARALVTRDRHFGALLFVQNLGAVVLYCPLLASTVAETHAQLAAVLGSYSEQMLHKAFVVVQPGRYRFPSLAP